MTHQHVDSFLKLKCATDILNVVSPISKASKEISEVYTIMRALRKLIYPGDSHFYKVLDLCAGNGLAGVTIAHVFNYEHVTSLDIRVPKRDWAKVRNYSYFNMNINDFQKVDIKNTVIVSNHPCQRAKVIVDHFCKHDAKALVLMPCCKGELKPRPQYMIKKLGKYGTWCLDLYETIVHYGIEHNESIKVHMYEDTHCLSPRNIVITAIRD